MVSHQQKEQAGLEGIMLVIQFMFMVCPLLAIQISSLLEALPL